MPFPLRHVAFLAVALLAVGACAQESDDPVTLLTEAAERTSAADGARVSMVAELTGSGPFDGVVLDLDALAAMDGSSMEGTMAMGGVAFDVLFVDGSYYYGFPDLPPGVGWVEITADELAEVGVDVEAAQQQQAGHALALLQEAGDVEEVGEETIDGAPTTRYRAITDLVSVNEGSGVLSGEVLEEVRGLLGDEVQLDVWVDDDGYVRRLEYGVELAEAPDPPPDMPRQGRLDYRFELSEFTDDYRAPAKPDPGTVLLLEELLG